MMRGDDESAMGLSTAEKGPAWRSPWPTARRSSPARMETALAATIRNGNAQGERGNGGELTKGLNLVGGGTEMADGSTRW
jgi:hypothetical protein